MNRRVLFVDDEPAVLEGIRRNLRKDFDVHTEADPHKALARLASEPPFAVIVADMRMPGLNGVDFLHEAKQIAPSSVRLMLTGDATRETPIGALNRGDVFKFVSKPCEPDVLRKVVEFAARKYDVDLAEKDVLQNTVRGSVTALAEVLALANPIAFGRTNRLRTLANALGVRLERCDAWELDTAALLSQLGCVCLPSGLLGKVAAGEPLTETERAEYRKHPALGAELVRKVPRLEGVAEAIRHQLTDQDAQLGGDDAIPLTARVLRVALEYDELNSAGRTDAQALEIMMQRRNRFDQRVLAALAELLAEEVPAATPVHPAHLECGMVVEQDVVTDQGTLLLCRGQEVTPAVRAHLQRFHAAGALSAPILASVKPSSGAPAPS